MRDLNTIKEIINPVLKKHEVKRASLFGSTVTGSSNEDSDIDVLVELKSGKSLFDLIRLKRDLEKELDREVDLITYNSLNPLLKEKILREKQDILWTKKTLKYLSRIFWWPSLPPWQVVKQDLPKLREQMLALKEELTEESDSR